MAKKSAGLRRRILLFIILILGFFLFISALLMNGLLLSKNQYGFFLDNYTAKNEALLNLQYKIYESTSSEKNYLLHFTEIDKRIFFESLEKIEWLNARLMAIQNGILEKEKATQEEREGHIRDLEQIESLTGSYKRGVELLFALLEEKGTDEESGLRGQFRTAAHDLEAILTADRDYSLMIEYLMMRRHEKDYLLRETDKYVQRNSASIQTIREYISSGNYADSVRQEMQQALDAYESGILRIIEVNREIADQEEFINQKVMELLPLLDEERKESSDLLKEERADLEQSVSSYFKLSLIIILSVLAISLFAAYRIFRQVSIPLKIILGNVESLAQGNLARESEYRKNDEMGMISRGLNQAVSALRALLIKIDESFADSLELSQNISSATTETSSAVTEITATLDSIKNQVENLSREVDGNYQSALDITEAVAVLDRLVENQSASVVQSSASVEQMMSSINSVSEITNQRARGTELLVKYTRKAPLRLIWQTSRFWMWQNRPTAYSK